MPATSRKPAPKAATGRAPAKKKAQAQPKRWTRDDADLDANSELGLKLKSIRLERGWSLAEAALQTGVTAGSWSRIENNKMAPTYAVLLKIMENLGIDWNQLMPVSRDKSPVELLSFSKGNATTVALKTARRTYPHGQKLDAPLRPAIVEISGNRPDNFELFAHEGTEFCMVLEGRLRFHAENRPAADLGEGESILFDSRLPHSYTSANGAPVKLLLVSTLPQRVWGHFSSRSASRK
jgi:transcriptional regulator with XRE-family HTH domain